MNAKCCLQGKQKEMHPNVFILSPEALRMEKYAHFALELWLSIPAVHQKSARILELKAPEHEHHLSSYVL